MFLITKLQSWRCFQSRKCDEQIRKLRQGCQIITVCHDKLFIPSPNILSITYCWMKVIRSKMCNFPPHNLSPKLTTATNTIWMNLKKHCVRIPPSLHHFQTMMLGIIPEMVPLFLWVLPDFSKFSRQHFLLDSEVYITTQGMPWISNLLPVGVDLDIKLGRPDKMWEYVPRGRHFIAIVCHVRKVFRDHIHIGCWSNLRLCVLQFFHGTEVKES